MNSIPTQAELLEDLDAKPHLLAQLNASARRKPDHPAIVFLRTADDAAPLVSTYADLDREATDVARAIRAAGVSPADGVAILLPIIPQTTTALVAAAAVAVAFPMNLLLSAEALATQMTLARVKLVITIGPHPLLDIRKRVDDALQMMDTKPHIVEVPVTASPAGGMSWNEFCASGANAPPCSNSDAAQTGALFHTGGTTGNPKLAQLSRRNLAAGALQAAYGLGWTTDDRVLSGLPLFHVGGAIDVTGALLYLGATIIIPTPLGLRDPSVVASFWSIIERTEATGIGAVPTMLSAIASASTGPIAASSRLRGVVTGGSAIADDLVRRIEEITGRPLSQLYGMTETAGIASAQKVGEPAARPCVGKPVPLARISIGAPGKAFECGAHGEIFISGPNCFQGYRTRDGLEAAPTGGWVASGDLGEVLPDGSLRIVGRSKDIIIRSGHNIDPLAIEDIAMSHPAVAEAAAVAMPDEYAGELPVLYIRPEPQVSFVEDDIRDHLNRTISDPPARPKQIFVMDQLPLTPFGKIARYRLRQMAAEHVARTKFLGIDGFENVECHDTAAKRLQLIFTGPVNEQAQAAIEALNRIGLVTEVLTRA